MQADFLASQDIGVFFTHGLKTIRINYQYLKEHKRLCVLRNAFEQSNQYSGRFYTEKG